MASENEKFLNAEKTAVELVEKLKKLENEATSYETATKELDTVREKLSNLIEAMETISSKFNDLIKTLKMIGTPEILSKLDNIESQSKKNLDNQLKLINDGFSAQSKILSTLNNNVTKLDANVQKGIKEQLAKLSEGFSVQTDDINKIYRELKSLTINLKEMVGTPEILSKLVNIENQSKRDLDNQLKVINKGFSVQSSNMNELSNNIQKISEEQLEKLSEGFSFQTDYINKINRELDGLKINLREEFLNQSKIIDKLNLYSLIIIVSSITSIMIGAIILFR